MFFSLVELNAAIAELLERLNTRRFRKLTGLRRSQFEQLDRPALRPLLAPYVFAEWKAVRVSMDYHVEVDGHYYSVPHALVHRQLDVGLPARTVECFHRGQRVASHVRSPAKGRHTTAAELMPEKHRRMGDWTPDRFIGWAEKTGPDTRPDHRRPRPASSPAGLPFLPRAPAPGQVLRRRPPGSGRRTSPRHRQLAATAASNRSSVTDSTRPTPSRRCRGTTRLCHNPEDSVSTIFGSQAGGNLPR